MVSWGEILLTVTAASYLLGRKELPKIGRFIGLYSGRSVGAIIRAKSEFFDATKDHEIVKLQREFQKGIQELNEIRSELTSVGTMARPHQPVGTVASSFPSSSSAAHTAAAEAHTPAMGSSFQHAHAASGSSVSVTPTATGGSSSTAPIRASVNVAALSERNEKRSEDASLALAELKLAERSGGYTTRIESVEGGADYVAASIVDSLLLDRVTTDHTTSASKRKP